IKLYTLSLHDALPIWLRILAIFEIGEGPAEFDVRPRREAVANLLVGEQLILDRDFIEDGFGDLRGRFELAELRVADVLAQLRTALEAGLALERTGFALERLDVGFALVLRHRVERLEVLRPERQAVFLGIPRLRRLQEVRFLVFIGHAARNETERAGDSDKHGKETNRGAHGGKLTRAADE